MFSNYNKKDNTHSNQNYDFILVHMRKLFNKDSLTTKLKTNQLCLAHLVYNFNWLFTFLKQFELQMMLHQFQTREVIFTQDANKEKKEKHWKYSAKPGIKPEMPRLKQNY